MPKLEDQLKRDVEDLFRNIKLFLKREGIPFMYKVVLIGIIIKFLKWFNNLMKTRPKDFALLAEKAKALNSGNIFFAQFLKENKDNIKVQLKDLEKYFNSNVDKFNDKSFATFVNHKALKDIVSNLRKLGIQITYLDIDKMDEISKDKLLQSFRETGIPIDIKSTKDKTLLTFNLPKNFDTFKIQKVKGILGDNELINAAKLVEAMKRQDERAKEIKSFISRSILKLSTDIQENLTDGKKTVGKTLDKLITELQTKHNLKIDLSNSVRGNKLKAAKQRIIDLEQRYNNGEDISKEDIYVALEGFLDALNENAFTNDEVANAIKKELKEDYGFADIKSDNELVNIEEKFNKEVGSLFIKEENDKYVFNKKYLEQLKQYMQQPKTKDLELIFEPKIGLTEEEKEQIDKDTDTALLSVLTSLGMSSSLYRFLYEDYMWKKENGFASVQEPEEYTEALGIIKEIFLKERDQLEVIKNKLQKMIENQESSVGAKDIAYRDEITKIIKNKIDTIQKIENSIGQGEQLNEKESEPYLVGYILNYRIENEFNKIFKNLKKDINVYETVNSTSKHIIDIFKRIKNIPLLAIGVNKVQQEAVDRQY